MSTNIDVKVTAVDPIGYTANGIVRISITSVNDAASLAAPLAPRSSPEDASISFTLPANAFVDPDGDALTFSALLINGQPLPSWLTFNAATRTFAGTPPADYNGAVNIRVIATDPAGLATTGDFVLNVTPVNDAPVLTGALSNAVAQESKAFHYALPANLFSDVDNSTLLISAGLASGSALPTWLTFDATTRTFTGIPPVGVNGALDIRVTARDADGLGASGDYRLTLVLLVYRGTTGNDVWTAVDGVDNTFVDTPVGMSASQGVLDSQSKDVLTGGTGNDTIRAGVGADTVTGGAGNDVLSGGTGDDVLDGGLGNDTYRFGRGSGSDLILETQEDVSRVEPYAAQRENGQTWVSSGNWVTAGYWVSQGYWAYSGYWNPGGYWQPDGYWSGDGEGNSSWIDTTYWVPTQNWIDTSQYVDTSYYRDTSYYQDTSHWQTTYESYTAYRAIASPAALQGDGRLDALQFGAGIGQQDLVFALDGNDLLIGVRPAGIATTASVSIDQLQDRLRLTNWKLIEHRVELFTFADGTTVDAFATVRQALQFNSAPALAAPLAPRSSPEDASISFTLPANAFVDPDGDALTFSALLINGQPLPSWLTFNAATSTFAGMPPADYNGALDVRVTASDGWGGTVSGDFRLTISPINDTPRLAVALPAQVSNEDTPVSFVLPQGSFVDVDNDELSLSARLTNGQSLPSWLSFNAATRSFTGTPPANFNGAIDVRVTASDPSGLNATSDFRLTIVPVNDAPVVVAPLTGIASRNTTALSFTLPATTFTDADGDALSLVATTPNGSALPNWITFNASTRTFSGTPPSGYVGAVDVVVTARDPAGFAASASLRLAFTPANTSAAVTGVQQIGTTGNDYWLATSGASSFLDTPQGMLDGQGLLDSLSNDILIGSWANDTVRAGVGSDYVYGGTGDDTIYGGTGNDTIDGGEGSDLLDGGMGNDTYLFGRGSGADTISESQQDVVRVEAYTAQRQTGQSWVTSGYMVNQGYWSPSYYYVSAGYWNSSGYWADGGEGGAYWVDTSSWIDTSYWAAQYNYVDTSYYQDTSHWQPILENYTAFRPIANPIAYQGDGSGDALKFDQGINADDLWLTRSANDLKVSVRGTQDSVIIKDWFTNTAGRVDQMVLGDGKVLRTADVDGLVNAMASFAATSGSTSAPTAEVVLPSLVQTAINSAWRA